VANPFQNFLSGLGKLLTNLGGGRSKTPPPPVEEPVGPPPQPVQQLPPSNVLIPPEVYTDQPTVQREGDNVFYVSATNKTLGRWQAGTGEQVVEREDIEVLLDTIPQNMYAYTLIFWGSTEGIYPGKISQDTYIGLRIEGQTMFKAFDDTALSDVVEWVNTMEDFQSGPRWIDIYTVSILDRF
jgi:hypothetical protein